MLLCATAACLSEAVAALLFCLAAVLCLVAMLVRRSHPATRNASVAILTKLQLALVVATDCAVVARFAVTLPLRQDSVLSALLVVGSYLLGSPVLVAHALQRQRRAGREGAAVTVVVVMAGTALLGSGGAMAYSGWLRQASVTALSLNVAIAALLSSVACVLAGACFVASRSGVPPYLRLSLREMGDVAESRLSSAMLRETEDELAQDMEEADGEVNAEDDKKDDSEGDDDDSQNKGDGMSRDFLMRAIMQEADLLGGALAMGIVMVTAALWQSFLWGTIVALVSAPATTSSAGELLRECLNLLYVVMLYSMLLGLQEVLVKVASLRVATSARVQLFASVMRRSMQFHITCKPGELMSRLSNDADAVSESTSHSVTIIRGMTMIVAGLVFLFVLNWKLTLILLASAPVVAVVTALLSRLNASTTARSLSAAAGAVSVAEECFAAAQTVRVFHMVEAEGRRYARRALRAMALLSHMALLNGVGEWVLFGIFNVVVLVAMWYAGSQVLEGAASVRDTVTFLLVMFDLTMEMERLPEALYSLSSGVGAARRIASLLAAGEEEQRAKRGRVEQAEEAPPESDRDWVVAFEGVSFAYPTRDVQVLRRVTLHIARGESIAICGASGCGKSTLLNLLFGNYAASCGSVRLNGRSVRCMREEEMRKSLALVPQEPMLFNVSVADNIGYGSQLSRQEVVEAATRANAHDFVMSLPEGYETRVGSKGMQLSGGQRQRLCIARALAGGRGSVLCLDEPTSSLDWASAQVVCQTLGELLQRRDRAAVILVTHQLALMRHVDRVVFLADGVVAATGTHKELCEREPAYRDLFGL